MKLFPRSLFVLLLLYGMVHSRPTMQRIVINNHVWEVPNEPGWDQVLEDVELIQLSLDKCTTVAECHQIINELRTVFYRHSVSRKYLESHTKHGEDILASIFKWG